MIWFWTTSCPIFSAIIVSIGLTEGLPMQQPEADYRPVRFSSSAFPERERMSAWRDFFGPTMFGADVKPLGEQAYRQDIVVRPLPGVSLLSADNTPVHFTRSRAMLSDGRGDYGLHINSGRSLVRQRSRDVLCEPGEPILVTSAEAASMESPEGSHFLCLHIDRSLLLKSVADPDDSVLKRVPRDNGVLRYLLGYVRFLETTDLITVDPDVAGNAGAHLADLLSLLFNATGDAATLAQRGGLRVARMLAIKRTISEALGEPALGVEHIAVRHGISVRSVQRIFEREGVTFSGYVLNRRLDQAFRMLGDPAHAKMLVIDIALACGFGDLSYFNRCFRRKFGETPGCFRR